MTTELHIPEPTLETWEIIKHVRIGYRYPAVLRREFSISQHIYLIRDMDTYLYIGKISSIEWEMENVNVPIIHCSNEDSTFPLQLTFEDGRLIEILDIFNEELATGMVICE